MKKILFILIATLLVWIPCAVIAADFDGNWTLANCSYFIDSLDNKIDEKNVTHDKNTWAFNCAGYISGFLNSVFIYQVILDAKKEQPQICLPTRIKDAQAIRVVLNYLRDHPDKLHIEQGVIVWAALSEAYPCRKK